MKLRKATDLTAFLRKVRLCTGEVWFVTSDGDQLNLKSVLSEFLFLSAAISSTLVDNGHVQFQNPEDVSLLTEYLEG